MKVEKVPDSTYDMIGGLDQQIKEIKEVFFFLLFAFLLCLYAPFFSGFDHVVWSLLTLC